MSCDVFYCTMPQDEFREAIARPCLMRWFQLCDPQNLTVVDGTRMYMGAAEFQGFRRQYAEDNSQTPYYVIADDDCMPLGNRFLERCEALMEKYPTFAVLGTSDYGLPYGPDEVFETSTAGGINVIRKGIIQVGEFRPWTSVQQAEQVRSKGFKIGRMMDVRRNHYGEGFSTLWPDNYKSGKTQVGYLDKDGLLV